MLVCKGGYATSLGCTGEESNLQEIGLTNVLNCYRFFTDRSGNSIKSNGATVIESDNSFKHTSIKTVKSELVDLKLVEGISCDLAVDDAVAKSRTRLRRRFAIRGVPRERLASSSAPSSVILMPRIFALLLTMVASSSGV